MNTSIRSRYAKRTGTQLRSQALHMKSAFMNDFTVTQGRDQMQLLTNTLNTLRIIES